MGSERFVHRTKKEFGARAKGRVVLESAEAFQLREPGVSYRIDFGPKKDDIGAVVSNNKCNGVLVIVIFEKYFIGRCKTQGFSCCCPVVVVGGDSSG